MKNNIVKEVKSTEVKDKDNANVNQEIVKPCNKNYAISLNDRNLINFKKDFYIGEKLEQYQYVTLTYNEDEKEIVFYFNANKQKHYSHKILHRGNSGLIFASAFYKNFITKENFGIYKPALFRTNNNRKRYTIKLKQR